MATTDFTDFTDFEKHSDKRIFFTTKTRKVTDLRAQRKATTKDDKKFLGS
jgi:hypothetical protein